MNHLFLMAPLLLMLQPNSQKLPNEFYQIPEQIRERATVVVSATFAMGRTPCFWRPDGTRVWGIDSSFHVEKVYRGMVGRKFISINGSMLPTSEYVAKRLEVDRKYLVLLEPVGKNVRLIRTKQGIGFWDSLRDEEIIAIVEIK
jgi:hypothetical protein